MQSDKMEIERKIHMNQTSEEPLVEYVVNVPNINNNGISVDSTGWLFSPVSTVSR